MGAGRPYERLTGQAQFQSVRKKGRRLRGDGFDIYVRKRSESGVPRLGMAVRRKIGTAVVRNRWKRLIREYVRMRSETIGAVDLVVIPHKPPPPNLWDLAVKFDELLKRFPGSPSSSS